MANIGQATFGALSGAGTGATIGSAFGPIGTGVGAVGGGLLGILGTLMGGGEGKRAGVQQTPTMTSSQTQAQNQLLQQIMQGLQNPQARMAGFEPIEQQARRDFQQKTLPSIAERFAGLGALNSSAFANTLGEAGSNLEGDLAAMRSQYGMQNQQLLNQLAPLAFQRNFEPYYQAYQPSFGESNLSQLLSMLPQLLQIYQMQQGTKKQDQTGQSGQA